MKGLKELVCYREVNRRTLDLGLAYGGVASQFSPFDTSVDFSVCDDSPLQYSLSFARSVMIAPSIISCPVLGL